MKPEDLVGGGRFLLIRRLGRGGMGEVWLARDQRLQEPVALKFLSADLAATPQMLELLRREVARSHRLSHPNIIRLHDFHEPPGEAPFISMEYVDGPSLNSLRLERESPVLPWEFLRKPVSELCAALAYAHAENVIHRDLKPDNLLMDSRGRLKLTDFGVAAMASDLARRGTITGGGTLHYMSPQQVQGKHPQITDDIYSLGATLYELCAGQTPFTGEDIREQILHQLPDPPRERLTALGLENEVPAQVESVILSCLSGDADQRPQSAAEVWDLLEPRAADPVVATPAGPTETTRREAVPLERSRPAAVWLIGLGVVLMVLAGGWLWKTHESSGRRSDSVLDATAVAIKPEAITPQIVVTNPLPGNPASNLVAVTPSEATTSPVTVTNALKVSPVRQPFPVAARWTNSLGMIFVPVPGSEVLFCIWKTRVQDFQAMADATSRPWEKPSFTQGATHPAVNIRWDDAGEFCVWLTQREREMQWLGSNQLYRLPSDKEWSLAVGLGFEKGSSPKEKDNNTPGLFPWGRQWPPPRGSGNFDPSLNVDEYLHTSPVGVFPANFLGLFDMAGNAREWCQDHFEPGKDRRVVRGSSWFDTPLGTLQSCRRALTPAQRHDNQFDYFGFRCALVTGTNMGPWRVPQFPPITSGASTKKP